MINLSNLNLYEYLIVYFIKKIYTITCLFKIINAFLLFVLISQLMSKYMQKIKILIVTTYLSFIKLFDIH